MSFYGVVYITLRDSSVWSIATSEHCSRGPSIDVCKRGAPVYLLSVGEAFWDRQVLLSEVAGIQIWIQFIFFCVRSWLPGALGRLGKGGSLSEHPDT